jgi:hypothetical protein
MVAWLETQALKSAAFEFDFDTWQQGLVAL